MENQQVAARAVVYAVVAVVVVVVVYCGRVGTLDWMTFMAADLRVKSFKWLSKEG